MIDDKGGDFEKFRMSDEQMKGMSRKVRHFYETQNEILVSPCLSHLGLAADECVGAVQDGFREVDEILDNTRAMAATGELAPMIPVRQASCEPPCSGSPADQPLLADETFGRPRGGVQPQGQARDQRQLSHSALRIPTCPGRGS